MEIRAAELTGDHLGRRIRLDYSNDDQTFVIARIVKILHKQVGNPADSETETRLTFRSSTIGASRCGSTVLVWLSFCRNVLAAAGGPPARETSRRVCPVIVPPWFGTLPVNMLDRRRKIPTSPTTRRCSCTRSVFPVRRSVPAHGAEQRLVSSDVDNPSGDLLQFGVQAMRQSEPRQWRGAAVAGPAGGAPPLDSATTTSHNSEIRPATTAWKSVPWPYPLGDRRAVQGRRRPRAQRSLGPHGDRG
jgi:hypothetical protein